MGDTRHSSCVGSTTQGAADDLPLELLRLEEPQVQQQLLPEIPDDLTLELITPKLSWSALIVLPSVSRVWQRAVQSRQVYDARVKAQATERLVVPPLLSPHPMSRYNFTFLTGPGLPGIRSTRDGTYRVLPGVRFPSSSVNEPEFLWAAHIASYDGKVYALAGQNVYEHLRSSITVFVLDLAGHGQWIECINLCSPRHFMVVSGYVIDGKIYVGDQSSFSEGFLPDEVYDPELNVWSVTTSVPKGKDGSFLAV